MPPLSVRFTKKPDESTGAGLALQNGVPGVLHALHPRLRHKGCAASLWGKRRGRSQLLRQRLIVRVVLGVGDTGRVVRPRVQDGTLFRIVLGVFTIQIEVEATFVAVIPKENRRVIYVVLHQFFDELLADVGVIVRLPAGQFIEHIQAKLVAVIEEVAVRRLVAGTNCIAVHLFDQVDVVYGDLLRQGPAGVGPERVARKTLQEDALAVDEHALSGAELDGSEPKVLTHGVCHGTA